MRVGSKTRSYILEYVGQYILNAIQMFEYDVFNKQMYCYFKSDHKIYYSSSIIWIAGDEILRQVTPY